MPHDFSHVADPVLRERLEISEARGAFQGYIGDYAVYQRDGFTYGYHQTNRGLQHDYKGDEHGLYSFAGVKPIEVHRRF